MTFLNILFFFVITFYSFANAFEKHEPRKFDSYKVLTVEAKTRDDYELLKNVYKSGEFDFWTLPKLNGSTDIMVSDLEIDALTNVFQNHHLTHRLKIDDVGRLVERERMKNRVAETEMSWTAFHPWAVIENWINEKMRRSPNVKVMEIGKTFENRTIYALRVCNRCLVPKKQSILIDANIHAREWISSATATWIVNELATNASAYSEILDHLDIYVIPLINIDGYEYTHVTNRMWRKTRTIYPGTTCRGCDPNRNWSFKFGEEGTSRNPCSDLYTGPHAFSESETAAVRDFILATEASGITFYAYLTFHAYSQLWLLPWGYTTGIYPSDYKDQLSLGEATVAALYAVHGTKYYAGQGADMLYGVGGASDDWAKDHGIKYTATVEMRDSGRHGFMLPADQIIPNAQEIWAAVQVVCKRVISTK